MANMKKTLLELVQSILAKIESDNVNSISDTDESDLVTTLVIDTYWDMIADNVIPDNYEVFRFTGIADSTRPTHLLMPADVSEVCTFKYNKSEDGTTTDYRDVHWKDPRDFLDHVMRRNSEDANVLGVTTLDNSVPLLVYSNKHPTYFTSFDNEYVVCDSYDSTVDTTLQTSKTLAYGEIIPTVTRSDSFQFDMDQKYFPMLLSECITRASFSMKGLADPIMDRQARRHRYMKNAEKYKLSGPKRGRQYGRT